MVYTYLYYVIKIIAEARECDLYLEIKKKAISIDKSEQLYSKLLQSNETRAKKIIPLIIYYYLIYNQ